MHGRTATARPSRTLRILGPLLTVALAIGLLAAPPAVAADTGDPSAGDQWHLDAVQVPLAWERSRGDDVVVAVLDSGITPGLDLRCREFVAEHDARDGTDGNVEDSSGHGTHIAGTIAQCSENGIRGAGVAPDVTLMDVKVLSASPGSGGQAQSAAVRDGILHAVENGADVINLSIASPCGPDTPTYDSGCRFLDVDSAIAVAVAADVVIVAAAGNDGSGRVGYPANHPDVIGVGSVDASLDLPGYATFGDALDLVAPGGIDSDTDGDGIVDGIYQEWYDPNTDRHRTRGLFGSSHAAAHVSGIAALLRSAEPLASAGEVRAVLTDTACTLGDETRFGAGLVRAADALEGLVADVGRGVCFLDVEPDSVFFGVISEFAQRDLTSGCTTLGNRYCPDQRLPRGQMAAFIDRALDLPAASRDYFVDDDDSIFEGSINRLREAGITDGCNPNSGNDRYCPDALITRGQMAKFLDRAFDAPTASRDYFVDDDDSIFEASINRIREARITLGCNPSSGNDRFCPTDDVSREQMAAFIIRALG